MSTTISRALIHDTDHFYSPDPDCGLCRQNWDWLGEAQAIYEGTSNLMPVRQHIAALFEKIDELENALILARQK